MPLLPKHPTSPHLPSTLSILNPAKMLESNDHQVRRHAIKTIARAICERRENRYQHKDLDNLHIQCLPMPLSADGGPLFEPEFFWPYDKSLPDPDEEIEFSPSSPQEVLDPMDEAHILSDYFGEYISCATLFHKFDWQHNPRQPSDFPCSLCELDIDNPIEWCVGGITGIPGGPRMKCFLLESVDADDEQITRGEILCMCRIMITCLRSRKYSANKVSPVLLISFVGPRHARILLGHHDGTNLVIRQSKRFAFWEQNIPELKILLRWWCSSAVGDTING
ncbi:hypothetical protein AtubIFM55763_006892 [Aspergillus tubingensis]|uniref:Uncharacterized protein n=1 Tax=Aspergillus tubingensis TaxID=5068 RepID=A0A9W6AS44_ASPTU|nr:hypothetical protein AtubIFM55763_006892 [Aspergillus tubingensis]GLA86537.1 hypothetical protein AtubIFM56815_010805 [Aspergillus tubingensis]GLA93524.1 hypothetical protein AtubIFM57143_011121 [Aspergillus tubingensis]